MVTDHQNTTVDEATVTTANTTAKDPQAYDVGYGKPPKHNQFKKGQSGNPNGRPKKSRNLRTLIQEELESTVILQENGRQIKTTKAAAMSKRLVNKALSGDARATQILIRMMPQEQQDAIVDIGDDDLAAFIDLRQRIETDHALNLNPQIADEMNPDPIMDDEGQV